MKAARSARPILCAFSPLSVLRGTLKATPVFSRSVNIGGRTPERPVRKLLPLDLGLHTRLYRPAGPRQKKSA